MTSAPTPEERVDDGSAVAPSRRTKRRRRLVVGVIVTVAALTAAVLVWDVATRPTAQVVALLPALPVTPVQDPATRGQNRVPDFTEETEWSKPFPLQLAGLVGGDEPNAAWYDGRADVIALVGTHADDGYQEIEAIDLATRTSLWTLAGPFRRIRPSPSGILLVQDDRMLIVDTRTGAVTAQTPWDPDAESVWAFSSDAIVTTNDTTGGLCGRTWTDPGTCRWEAPQSPDWDPCGVTRLGENWINSDHGVLDAATGEPAAFGGDAGVIVATQTFYVGIHDDLVLRMITEAGCTGFITYQSWDPMRDAPVGPVVRLDTVRSLNAAELPLVIERHDDGTMAVRRSQDGTTPWTYTPPSGKTADGITLAGPYAIVDLRHDDEYQGMVVLDDSGETVWSSDEAYWLDAGERVGYIEDDTHLYAFDLEEPGFPQLWSIPLPGAKSGVVAMGGHLFAVDAAAGQVWVLRPAAHPGDWPPRWPR